MSTDIDNGLKNKLLEIALSTDCCGEYNLQGWRLEAVCAARWLLRAAAIGEPSQKYTTQVFKELAKAVEHLNDTEYAKKLHDFMT